MKSLAAAAVLLALFCWGAVWQFRQVRRDLSAKHDAILTAWAQVDDDLKNRADLGPSLADLVQDTVHPSPAILDRLEKASENLGADRSPQDEMAAYSEFNAALAPLLAVAQRSPALRKRRDFLAVQYELESTENRIAHSRSLYNEAVKRYNTKLRLFPGNLVGYLSSYRPETAYFKTEAGRPASSAPPASKRK